ncbi:hypothetical protein CYMTET_30753 [Cymbomonas tetramitiformis]|uniref:gamma-glutamylcyclotransferase n=1 Tax=Cymbomonas tetramitiformis TaxID=36881 RepID=A0AAE0FIJ3_9CHLO|nr:hypothetical protein CYMTET_30753 [Cymbomonas tetramitiformis]|eukprot:gene7423-8837_t
MSAASAAEPPQDGPLWYFAIGSMCNQTSITARDVHPIESKPAELLEYKIVFQGPNGMAGIEHSPGERGYHGVVHLLSTEDMLKLDKIEIGYDRVEAKARLYDDSELTVTVYKYSTTKTSAFHGDDNPPSQRYIEIIVEGCTKAKVSEGYIQWLKTIEREPRTSPENFRKLPDPPTSETMTKCVFDTCDGEDGRPFCSVLNGKVVEYKADSPMMQAFKNFPRGDIAFFIARNIYDPKYGMPATPDDMTPEHRESAENFWVDSLNKGGMLDHVKVIAMLQT